MNIRASSAAVAKYIAMLKSTDQATRIAALGEMMRSGEPMLADLAIETGLASGDKAMQALALRGAFRQVRSIVADVRKPATASLQVAEILKHCASANYIVENFDYKTGKFEVRGQDSQGVGQVSGGTVSLTIEYGCSLNASLSRDGRLEGIISAPYRKGSINASFAFR